MLETLPVSIPDGPSVLCPIPSQLRGLAWYTGCRAALSPNSSPWCMSLCAEVGAEAQMQPSRGPQPASQGAGVCTLARSCD